MYLLNNFTKFSLITLLIFVSYNAAQELENNLNTTKSIILPDSIKYELESLYTNHSRGSSESATNTNFKSMEESSLANTFGPIAFSASGTSHKSSDDPTILSYPNVITTINAAWKDGFVAMEGGIFLITISFVKDAYETDATTGDVSIELHKGNLFGPDTLEYIGRALSGAGSGTRGVGTYTTILELESGGFISTFANSYNGEKRHLIEYSISICSIN